MDLDEYARKLGALIANLHSFEFVLRAYLAKRPGAQPIGVAHGVDIFEQPVGTVFDESDLTSYDSLGQFLRKFNADMRQQGAAQVDEDLINLRDALAHGRVSASAQGDTLRLIKFDQRDAQGRVRLKFTALLTADWFSAQTKRVYEAIALVDSKMRT